MKKERKLMFGTAAALSSPGDINDQTALPPISFRSAEFNHIDELDDNADNYRSFRSLDGIVTADMRHHAERQRREPPVRESVDDRAPADEEQIGKEAAARDEDILPVTVVSRGRTLIIATDSERAAEFGQQLGARGLTCTLCVPAGETKDVSLSRIDSLSVVAVCSVSVSGSFGGFMAMIPTDDGQTNLACLLGHETGSFDLVLDLQSATSYAGKQLPLGYYAPGADGARLDAALAELPEMRGRFKKPRFTVFMGERCMHGLSRSRDCLRCLAICPVAAIKPENRGISIDPYLCQGCGSCALVCPADAIQPMHPSPGELPSALRELLSGYLATSDSPPDLILYDRDIDGKAPNGLAGPKEDRHIYYGVDDIGRIGLEILLAALAYGAGSVSLVCDGRRPDATREALQRQVLLGGEILRGLHMPTDRIRFAVLPEGGINSRPGILPDPAPFSQQAEQQIPQGTFSPDLDKRSLTRKAAQHLFEASGLVQPVMPLSEGAPFGAVAIEAAACSLCMACVAACPSGALSAAGDAPRLSLVESRCHQCGLCMDACPEDAIQLLPRLLCNAAAAEAPVVLREVEPFPCVECGAPFASQAMINRMEEKLTGHWMYGSDRQLRRLRMCRTCRTRDALMAQDYRS